MSFAKSPHSYYPPTLSLSLSRCLNDKALLCQLLSCLEIGEEQSISKIELQPAKVNSERLLAAA